MAHDTHSPRWQPNTSSKPAAPKAAASTLKTEKASERDMKSRVDPVNFDSPRWLVPLMLTCFLAGLLWIVTYYIAPEAPGIAALDYWNVAGGFALFIIGFFLSTRWR